MCVVNFWWQRRCFVPYLSSSGQPRFPVRPRGATWSSVSGIPRLCTSGWCSDSPWSRPSIEYSPRQLCWVARPPADSRLDWSSGSCSLDTYNSPDPPAVHLTHAAAMFWHYRVKHWTAAPAILRVCVSSGSSACRYVSKPPVTKHNV